MDIMEEQQFQRVQRMGGKCKGGIYQSQQNLSYTKKEKSQKSCSVKPCLKAILEITNNFERKLTTAENCQFLIINGQSTQKERYDGCRQAFCKRTRIPLLSIHNQAPIQRTDPETVYGPLKFATRNANLTEYRLGTTHSQEYKREQQLNGNVNNEKRNSLTKSVTYNVRIISIKVCGLASKLGNPEFVNFINKND